MVSASGLLYLILTKSQKVMKMIDFKKTLLAMSLTVAASTNLYAQKSPQWLSNAVFYQIYPSSYMDSDGNGIGDLPGIISRLDYIQSLGVNALWLNPIFKSGWFDGGYDIIDFYQVDPRFGTNSDLVALVKEAHKRGMKVCLDLVAGHTSDKCAWFKESAQKAGTELRICKSRSFPSLGAGRECSRSAGCTP
jgi:maltose alpha-D-glucosyltransferase/alpha-amylase